MATVSKGREFVSGETVTPAKLNELVDNATVTAIQTADISDSQITTAKIADSAVTNAKIASGVDASKLTTGTLPADRIGSGAITAAKLDGAQTGSAPIYGCRAWVNFDGTTGSTVGGEFQCTIRASGNVSKVVRTFNPGEYRVHFSIPMEDANYAVAGARGTSTNSSYPVTGAFEISAKSSSTFIIQCEAYGNTWSANLGNSAIVDAIVFR